MLKRVELYLDVTLELVEFGKPGELVRHVLSKGLEVGQWHGEWVVVWRWELAKAREEKLV